MDRGRLETSRSRSPSQGNMTLRVSSRLSTSRYHLSNDVFFQDEASVLRWAQTFPALSDIPSYVENLYFSYVSLLDDIFRGILPPVPSPPLNLRLDSNLDISHITLDLSTFTCLKGF